MGPHVGARVKPRMKDRMGAREGAHSGARVGCHAVSAGARGSPYEPLGARVLARGSPEGAQERRGEPRTFAWAPAKFFQV